VGECGLDKLDSG